MSTPARFVSVRNLGAVAHLAPAGPRPHVAPALCGTFPARGFDPASGRFDGPARWSEVRPEAPEGVRVCAACKAVAR